MTIKKSDALSIGFFILVVKLFADEKDLNLFQTHHGAIKMIVLAESLSLRTL